MTAEVKHTEGPWERVDTADYAEIHPVGKRLHSAIALVGKPEDADLVSACTDLLEATRIAESFAKFVLSKGSQPSDENARQLLLITRKAIAKATGGQ